MTQKPTNKKGVLFLSLTLGGALLCALLHLFALLFSSDAIAIGEVHTTVLFKKGPLPVILAAATVVFAAALLCALFFWRKTTVKDLAPMQEMRIPRLFLTAACGVALVFTVPLQYILDAAGTPYELAAEPFSLRSSSSMQQISLILAIVASLYFFIALFAEKQTKLMRIARVAAGLVLALYFCAQLLVVHNYMNDMLGSPTRIFNLTSTCFIIFFLLSEINLSVSNREKPALCAATGMVTFLVTMAETIPTLALSFAGAAGYRFDINVFYLLLRFFIGLYALLGALPVLFARPQSAPEETAAAAPDCTEGTENTPETPDTEAPEEQKCEPVPAEDGKTTEPVSAGPEEQGGTNNAE